MNKSKNYKYLIVILLISSLTIINNRLNAESLSKTNKGIKLNTSIEIKEYGILKLIKSENKQTDTSQLILKNPKNMTIIVDNYEGLEPYELINSDLDKDGNPEIIATLKYPDSNNVIPYVYTLKDGLEKIFPSEEIENKLTSCCEVFVTPNGSKQALCLKYLVNYHDYAPPELFKLEMYNLNNGIMKLDRVGYNEGTHYNLLMNLATEYMHIGKTLEASILYHEAIASSTGEMSKKAFCEALFLYAESLSFSGKYSEAMKNFEKLVLEYTDSDFTEVAQRELEFLYTNTKDPKNLTILKRFFKILHEIEYEHSEQALTHLEQLISENKECNFLDRMLYVKAELLISDNKVDEAIAVFTDIKVKCPNSPLIELVEEMIENLECKPEDTEGL